MVFNLAPQFQQPKSRSELLAAVLKQMQEEGKKPNPRTWAETGIRALGQGLQGYVAGKSIREDEKRRAMLADAIGADDELRGLINADVISDDALAKVLLERKFAGKKKPIEINGRLVDPDTYEVIKDFSDPKAPQVETFFDPDSGQEYKAQLNPSTGEWERVGGLKAGGRERSPNNYMVPGLGAVLSHDDQTYTDPETGERKPLPPTAVRMGAESAVSEARTQSAIDRARQELEPGEQGAQAATDAGGGLPPIEEAAREGTGPWRNLAAAADAVVGGLTEDQVFGEGGLFPETQTNRQALRNFNQIAKGALVNNPRFPVAEQQLVQKMLPDPDTFWQNPATAVKQVQVLRQTLLSMKEQNLRSIASGALDPKTTGELVAKNAEIDRVLQIMGPTTGSGTNAGQAGPGVKWRVIE
jgi:hypothetical protein